MTSTLTRQDFFTTVRLLGVIWLGLVFVVFLREFAGTLTIRDWNYPVFEDLRHLTFNMWLPWVLMSPVVVLLIKRFLFLPDRLGRTIVIHILLVSLFTVLHLAGVAYYYEYFVDDQTSAMRVYAGWEHMGHFLVADPFILTDVIVYVLFLSCFNISSHIALVRQKEQVASRLETHLAESKLRALQMQVNPHFLFNTLNSITALIRKQEVDTAEEMIHRLGDFFRMTLERNIGQLVPFEVELELIDNYLAIEQQRYQERLQINKSIDAESLSVEVPALMLQPIIENCFKHGLHVMEGTASIGIRSHLLADRLLIEVTDNGPGDAGLSGVEYRRGIGLNNVRERLQQLYGDSALLQLESTPGVGTRVSIEIPVAAPQQHDSDARSKTESAPNELILNPGKA